jgi:hypothetical protein
MAEPGCSTYRYGLGFQGWQQRSFFAVLKRKNRRPEAGSGCGTSMSYTKRLEGDSSKKTHIRSYAMTTDNICHSNNSQRDDASFALL